MIGCMCKTLDTVRAYKLNPYFIMFSHDIKNICQSPV